MGKEFPEEIAVNREEWKLLGVSQKQFSEADITGVIKNRPRVFDPDWGVEVRR